MLGLGALLGGICVTCVSPDQPTAVQVATAAPHLVMALAAGDGCARLHIRVGPGSTATVTAIDEGNSCRADELEVRVDSAPVFDATSGVLRLAVVMRNAGTIPMGVPARLTFIADSANLFDENGNLLPGKPDIVAHNADSANATGRIGVWRYDAYLAPNAQPQVLAAGATSQPRWLEFRSTDWRNAIRISLGATALEPSPNVVPELPPQNIPKALMDSLGSITMPSGQLAVPDMLGVSFVLGATQQQRQAAIDAVRGVVVGGRSAPAGSDGTYYVLIPAQRSDSLLLVAADALLSLPQVATAEILYRNPRDEAAYRRPHDGAGFERPTWNVRSSEAAGQNWALERINAPLAWGCETGSPSVRVAIVDRSYARQSEVDDNVAFLNALPDSLGSADRHGLRVTSVLGAPANNGRGIAGVMWQAAVDFRDWNAEPLDYTRIAARASALERLRVLEDHIVLAGLEGAPAVSLSRSNTWTNSVAPDTSGARRASVEARTEIRNSAAIISRALARLRASNKSPLLVIAAGNDNLDARYSGFNHPARRALDSAQVIVVGGMLQTGERDDSSNFGPLVSVYAPSRDVAVIKPLEVVTLDHGTSFAAPLVAGTAGLLLSFDPGPHMTAAELKRLILEGAVDSVTEPNGTRKPILNAYGALRKAAERFGAPLCGNRVWAASGKLWAERSVVNGTPNDDSLATIPAGARSYVGVFHGGRRIQNLRGSGWTAFTWTPATGWASAAPVFDDTLSGGTWWSSFGIDHELTTRLWTRGITTAGVQRVQFFTTPVFGGSETVVGTSDPIRAGIDSSTAQCIMRHKSITSSCRQSVFTTYQPIVAQSIAPEGDRGFVAVTQARAYPILSSFVSCSTDPAEPEECAPFTVVREIIGPSTVYEVDLRNTQTMSRWTAVGASFYLAVSERNDNLVASEGTYVRREFVDFFPGAQSSHSFWNTASVTITGACSVVYRDIRRPAVTGSEHRRIATEPLNGCDDPSTGRFAGGTIAPRPRIPIAPTTVEQPERGRRRTR